MIDSIRTDIPVVARASVSYGPVTDDEGRYSEEAEVKAKADYLPQINQIAAAPLSAEDVHVFKARVINSKLISFGGRFPSATLLEAAPMMVGAPLMHEHNYQTAPIGRHFAAKRIYLENKVDSREENYWVEAVIWVPNDAEGTAIYTRVKQGIFDQSSAAWAFSSMPCSVCKEDMRRCTHWPMDVYEKGGLAFFEMEGMLKYYESSIVFQGAVQGTHMVPLTASASGGADKAQGDGQYRAWLASIEREFGGVTTVEDVLRAKATLVTGGRPPVGFKAGDGWEPMPVHTGCTCGEDGDVARGTFVERETVEGCTVTVLQCESCEGYSVGWRRPGAEKATTVVVPPGEYASVESMFAAASKTVAPPRTASNPEPSVRRNVQALLMPVERFETVERASRWARWRGFRADKLEAVGENFVLTQWDRALAADQREINIEASISRKTNPVIAVVANKKDTQQTAGDKPKVDNQAGNDGGDDGTPRSIADLFSGAAA